MSAIDRLREHATNSVDFARSEPLNVLAAALLELDERLRRVEEQTAKTAQLMSQQELAVLLEKVR